MADKLHPRDKGQSTSVESQGISLQPAMADFALEVQRESGENILRCYYCQKCSVGCPTAFAMDYKPAQVIKMIQLGMRELLLKSSAPWLCVGCETCGTRCPNEIRVGPVMDTLKYMALAEGYAPPETKVYALHRSFLDNIKFFGRLHELSMLVEYKLRSMDLISDLDLGALLLLKRKISILPERIKGVDQVKELYKKAGR